MKKIIFATNNQHKLDEVKALSQGLIEIISLKELGFQGTIPETGQTLAENASQKARFIYEKYGQDCFADDTGLEVEALGGAPGVYSARYAGENATYEQNTEKLLKELQGIENRKACFKTVVSLILDGKEYFFEGKVEGIILPHRTGNGGFGYDPVFLPDGYQETFALMPGEVKNEISHRGRAMVKLIRFLQEYIKS
jgi:XTP/dITP diphosphohydrolase